VHQLFFTEKLRVANQHRLTKTIRDSNQHVFYHLNLTENPLGGDINLPPSLPKYTWTFQELMEYN
jgi:hypothetical protein